MSMKRPKLQHSFLKQWGDGLRFRIDAKDIHPNDMDGSCG
jgi:hypothetical protein